eukprot:m51a1_g8248 hypothetical protein (877) ;mRNA; r:130583-134788
MERHKEVIAALPAVVQLFPSTESAIWVHYKDNPDWCRTLTGFVPQFVYDLGIDAAALAMHHRRAAHLTIHDGVFVLLSLYKTDATPFPICKPNIGFEGTKVTFDAHHRVYAKKIEVAVSVNPPFKALMWSQLHNGAVSDIMIHHGDDGAVMYTDWLQRKPAEEEAIYGYHAHEPRFWTALMDSGYTGHVDILFKHVVLAKPSVEQTVTGRLVQQWYKTHRVVIEQFFSHMKKIFLISAKLYMLDKGHMQEDTDNVIFLTNHHIDQSALAEEDGAYYLHWINFMFHKKKEIKEKKAKATRAWHKRTAEMVAQAPVRCEQCGNDPFCGLCFTYLHRKGNRAAHTKKPLAGVDLAQHTEPQLAEGTTEYFTALQKARAISVSPAVSPAADGAPEAAAAPKGSAQQMAELAQWVPMRLDERERALLQLLEGALEISAYTDKVDVSFDYYGWRTGGMDKQRIIDAEIEEVLRLICGLYVAGDYASGKKILEASLEENAEFFQKVFEIGRRFKIMNPDKMRTTYGKMVHILQDCTLVKSASCPFEAIQPILTVRRFLEAHGASDVLSDPDLGPATLCVVQGSRSRDQVAADIRAKSKAQSAMVKRHVTDAMAHDGALTEDGLRRALDSLADANAYLAANRDPVERMLAMLQQYFKPQEPGDDDMSLAINYGQGGSCLCHSHAEQYEFARQSLELWRSVQGRMFELWCMADRDLLEDGGVYRLWNTGQGLNRVQNAPNVSRVMHDILSSVQSSIARPWLGLSVVHLGDRDVPNSLFFIDKYTQVPRILAPIVRAVERMDQLEQCPDVCTLVEICGGKGRAEYCKTFILRDFFRHGFDGSGSDGGSCVDGRLTSCWNWCSKVEKKAYYPLLLATGFDGFDGSFR